MKFKGVIISLFVFFMIFISAFLINQSDLFSHFRQLSLISLIFLMLLAGILDGFNPCAFSTLLLWSGFLLNRFGASMDKENINEKRKLILSYAYYYSFGIFLVYLLLGLGFLQFVNLTSKFSTSLFSQIMSVIVIVLGIIMIRDSLFPHNKAMIKMPKAFYPIVQKFSEPTTKLSAFLSGVAIGLCAIPCGGAIYMGILMIIQNNTFISKYPLLLLYNIGFVLPVLMLAFTLTNKKMLQAISRDFIKSRNKLKLIIAIITIALGLLSIYLT